MLKASWRALADCINDNDEKVASSKKKPIQVKKTKMQNSYLIYDQNG